MVGCNLVQMKPSAKKKEVVAEIEKEKITQQDLNYYLALEKINWKIQEEKFPTEEEEIILMKTQILDVLVGSEMLVYLAKQDGITIDEKGVSSDAAEMKRIMINQLKGGEEYEAFLEEEGITIEEFDGFLEGYFLANQYIEGLRKQVTEDIKISDEECEKYYQENTDQFDSSTATAKHILADQDSKELAEKIAKKAKEGADFDKLIEEYTGQEGILEAADLGEFSKAQMVPEFSNAAFALEAGESTLAESQFGFHIIKLLEKNEQAVQELDEVKDDIALHLKQAGFIKYLEEKEAELEIKKYPEKL